MLAVCIGLDVHKRYSYVAVVNETGEIVEEKRIENTKESLQKFASKYKGAKAVIEATSNYRFIYDVLENYMEVKLAHPYKTRAIAEARIKNDRLDAKMLAHLLSKPYSRKLCTTKRTERSYKSKKGFDRGQKQIEE